jgi:hypothetical protein
LEGRLQCVVRAAGRQVPMRFMPDEGSENSVTITVTSLRASPSTTMQQLFIVQFAFLVVYRSRSLLQFTQQQQQQSVLSTSCNIKQRFDYFSPSRTSDQCDQLFAQIQMPPESVDCCSSSLIVIMRVSLQVAVIAAISLLHGAINVAAGISDDGRTDFHQAGWL